MPYFVPIRDFISGAPYLCFKTPQRWPLPGKIRYKHIFRRKVPDLGANVPQPLESFTSKNGLARKAGLQTNCGKAQTYFSETSS